MACVLAGGCATETQSSGQAAAGDTAAARASFDSARSVAAGSDWTSGVVDVPAENDGIAVLRAVRVGRHEGFERITFEFEGDRMPGYRVEYVDRPVYACGSGEVVELPGDAFLSIRFEPAAAHTEQGQPTIPQREIAVDQPIIRALKRTCDFEGQVVWVTGQATPAPFAVRVLRSPLRLVVDLRG